MAKKRQIVECVPNFSEGRDLNVIKQITDAVEAVEGVKRAGRPAGRRVPHRAGREPEIRGRTGSRCRGSLQRCGKGWRAHRHAQAPRSTSAYRSYRRAAYRTRERHHA